MLRVYCNVQWQISRRAFAQVTLACLAGLTGASSANADVKPLTLREALVEFDHSPQIERSASVAEESSWRRAETYSGFLPRISASASRLLDARLVYIDVALGPSVQSIPQIIPKTVYSLGADWIIFDGFANFERLKGAKAVERAAKKDLEWSKFQGSRDVVLLFYRALAAQTLKDVAAANVKTLQDHLNDVRLFKKAGTGTKFDVLRVEVQTSESQSELLNSTDNVSVSLLRLGERLGQDLSHVELKGQLPVLAPDLVQSLKYEEHQRGDLEALQERVAGADYNASAAGRFWIPRVSLNGQYQQYNNRTDDFSGNGFRDAYSAAVNLNWNIFDGGISYARDRQAVEQKVQAEKSWILARQKSSNDFEFWRRRYLYYASVYRSRESDVDKSTESVRLAREGRKVGIRTNTDLLDAETELFRARAGLVNSQIGAIEALINLEVATGQSLFKFE